MEKTMEKTTMKALDERLGLRWCNNGTADHTGFLADITRFAMHIDGNGFHIMKILTPGSSNHCSHSYGHNVLISANEIDLASYLLEENDLAWRTKINQPFISLSQGRVKGYIKMIGHQDDPAGYKVVAAIDKEGRIETACVELHKRLPKSMEDIGPVIAGIILAGASAEEIYKGLSSEAYFPNHVRKSDYSKKGSAGSQGRDTLTLDQGRQLFVVADFQKLKKPVPAHFEVSELIAQVEEGFAGNLYDALKGIAPKAVEARHSVYAPSPSTVIGATRPFEIESAVVYCKRKD
jgi:hypothetical protein